MPFELSPDQRMYVNSYRQQYAQIQQHITRLQNQTDRLVLMSNQILNNIQAIYTSALTTTTTTTTTPTTDLMTSETSSYLFRDIENPLNTDCPIRLDPFEPNSEVVRINRCGHIFNRSELSNWFRTNSRCPLCRTELRPPPQQQHVEQEPSLEQTTDQIIATLFYDLIFPQAATTDLSNNHVRRGRWLRNSR